MDKADEKSAAKTLHPSHGWGKLAENPLQEIGSHSEAHREVLRRIWRRQGGDDDSIFDSLIPPAAKQPERKKR